MALPKLQQATTTITLPFTKQKVQIRPYSLGDERILLQAAESRKEDALFYVNNTLNVVRNCLVSTDVDIENLPSIDVEYMLLQIRGISQGETIDIEYADGDKKHRASIPIREIYATPREKDEYRIAITDTVGVIMKELTFRRKMELASAADQKVSNIIFNLIVDSVQSVYDENDVYEVGVSTTREEVQEFLMQATGVSRQLYSFVRDMPQIKVDVVINSTKKTLTGNEINFLA